jgi:hypothetical protein
MSELIRSFDYFPIILIVIIILSAIGLIITLTLYFKNKSSSINGRRRSIPSKPPSNPGISQSIPNNVPNYGYPKTYFGNNSDRPDITTLGINEIKACGKFTPAERAADYRRRGKSPSGVIDGVYNDAYRGNEAYNDSDRDWEADA